MTAQTPATFDPAVPRVEGNRIHWQGKVHTPIIWDYERSIEARFRLELHPQPGEQPYVANGYLIYAERVFVPEEMDKRQREEQIFEMGCQLLLKEDQQRRLFAARQRKIRPTRLNADQEAEIVAMEQAGKTPVEIVNWLNAKYPPQGDDGPHSNAMVHRALHRVDRQEKAVKVAEAVPEVLAELKPLQRQFEQTVTTLVEMSLVETRQFQTTLQSGDPAMSLPIPLAFRMLERTAALIGRRLNSITQLVTKLAPPQKVEATEPVATEIRTARVPPAETQHPMEAAVLRQAQDERTREVRKEGQSANDDSPTKRVETGAASPFTESDVPARTTG